MDKELVKDIIGRPRWWLIAVPLMVAFVVVASLLLPDDANSAVPPSPARSCPSGEWSCYTADQFASDFRAGKYGSSHGVDLPRKVKRMIDQKMAARGFAARDDGDSWWRRTLSFTTCIGGLRWQGACRRGQGYTNDVIARTSRIQVYCSGLAVIGSLAGGGAWGAGKAAGACLWTRLMGLWH